MADIDFSRKRYLGNGPIILGQNNCGQLSGASFKLTGQGSPVSGDDPTQRPVAFIQQGKGRLFIRCRSQDGGPHFIEHIAGDDCPPGGDLEFSAQAAVAVLGRRRKHRRIGNVLAGDEPSGQNVVLAEPARSVGVGHEIGGNLALRPVFLQIVENGAQRRLQRQTFLAAGMAPAQLEAFGIGRRQLFGPNAATGEGIGQKRRAEFAHGRHQQLHPFVGKSDPFAACGTDGCASGFILHGGGRTLALVGFYKRFPQFAAGADNVEEGLDPRFQSGIGSVAVEFQGEAWFCAHGVAEIGDDEGIRSAGKIGDIGGKELRVSRDELGATEQAIAHGPIHVDLLVQVLILKG
ncbi:MAG: hypothetical protein ACD_75C01232G0001 [uncultured bacterium]|nr:MAG: hypothetical protein ACD_75C01232G0001 [uncultured bacterium]